MRYLYLFGFIFLSHTSLKADTHEVYEVTSTSIPSAESTGGYETVIKDTEIEEYQEVFLKDALPYAPSILLNSRGTTGRQVDFSIRGARSSQNLVLMDGIMVNDPAFGGSADLSDFLNTDLERIEFLPGPQNLVYGPGALGGVVQLIPKRGQGAASLKAHGEGGSFRTRYGTLTGQGEEGPLQFSVTAAGFGRGPSSFTNQLHGNRQSDRYRNETLSSRVNYALTDNWEIEGLLRFIEGKVQFDDQPQELPTIAKNFTDFKTLLTSLENKWGYECVDHSLKLMYSRFERHTKMPSFHNDSLGEHPLFLYHSDLTLNTQNKLLVGCEGGQERAKAVELHTRSHGGIFLIHTFKPFESTALKGGIRGDHYQSLGSYPTFNVGADQKVTETTTLRTSYGTNFKPPVLSDLYQKNLLWTIPNPFLKPEKSRSFEAGVDQTFCKERAKLSLTGFITRIEKITLSRRISTGKSQRVNGGKRITKGFEIAFSLSPLKTVQITTAFTLTRARDFPEKKKSPLIPSFKGAGGIQWKAFSDLSFFIQGYSVTSRKDSFSKHTLSPYGVIHLGGAYDLTKHVALFGRLENLTNKHYEEVFGYGTRGRAFFIGIEAKT